MAAFGRLLTAMVTPFDSNLEVDYRQAAALAQNLVANGSDGLVVAGSTGEAATLSFEEKCKLFATVLEAVGDRATVIAGTGSNDTSTARKLTREAEKIGVHGAMVVGPYYNKPPQEGLFQHFKAISEETALPLIVYNVPGRTASNILPATVLRLAEFKNIAAIKEASGSLDQVSEIVRNAPADFVVYSGDDSLTLPMLAIGGHGVISVAAHLAGREMHAMIDAFLAGDTAAAKALHLRLMPFFKIMFITTNPIPVKEAVNLSGFNAGGLRPPLIGATQEELAKITKVMKEFDLQ
ncbi:MAG TPA: 4-hydroxy-tetrahydrodipicolinate synthase [Negativicutes bacterium]|nr:4-hydroxy-tetrahydrodipicolinate synthase [Negativicutes bacterium]